MSNGFDKLVGGIGKAIEVVPDIYKDVFKPTAKESGRVLAIIPQTINAALIPLRKWNVEREYNFQETEKLLAQKLKHINPNKIVTPNAYVAVPAIQALSYSMDSEELRNLYANLLAKAMNKDTKDAIHPAYIETIKQLSPDDASYFKYICPLDLRPMADVILSFPQGNSWTITENSNLANQKILLFATESYNANTKILLSNNIFDFSLLLICFVINGRTNTVVIGRDYLTSIKGVSYIFASTNNAAIGSIYYVDSTHVYLENGLSKLQIYGFK